MERIAGSQLNIWRSLNGLPRDVWVLALASLVNRAGTMVLPFLVLYLTRELSFIAPRAGLALAVYGAGSILAGPIAGWLSDRVGPLPVMRFSLILTGIILLAFPWLRGFGAILAMTLVWALVSESFRPANLAIVADIVPQERLKSAYALMRLAINLGMSVGPAAAGFIATRSFTAIFIVDGLTTIVAGLVLILLPMSHARASVTAHARTVSRGFARLLIFEDTRMLLFLSALFLTGVVFFQHEGALPLFLVEDLDLSPAFYGLLFTINTVMIVFMEIPLNAATAHWPHRTALALGAFLFASGSGAFAFATGPVMIVAGIAVWTFGEMLIFPQASAYVAEIAPPHRRGQYMGAYSVAFSGAFAFAPWAGTAALTEYGARPMWIAVFLVGAVSAIMMLWVTVNRSGEARAAA